MFSCPHTRHHVRQWHDLPLFPFIPLVPILMAGSVLGLLIVNYINTRKILDIVEGMESDLAGQGQAPENEQPGEVPESGQS